MSKIFFVTGGCGFIGSAVVRHLIENTNYKVINIDKLTYAGNVESLISVEDSERYIFENIDICNLDEITKLYKKYEPDCIMHLAAESHVDRSITGPYDFIKTNIFGTYVLLEVTRNYLSSMTPNKRNLFRFHHISTDEVFGDLPHPDFESNHAIKSFFTETSSYNPSSPYSATKASSDHLVRAWGRTYGLPVVITNCSNNYGPYHFPEKLIPLTILNALAGKSIPVYGEGQQIRDWLYVEDHARALILVAENGRVGETYNIGGNNEKRNIEVINTICAILDELVPVNSSALGYKKFSDLIVYVKDRPGHDMRYAIDATKIKNELGWKPRESFDSGIKKTILWYLENTDWCRRVQNKSNLR